MMSNVYKNLARKMADINAAGKLAAQDPAIKGVVSLKDKIFHPVATIGEKAVLGTAFGVEAGARALAGGCVGFVSGVKTCIEEDKKSADEILETVRKEAAIAAKKQLAGRLEKEATRDEISSLNAQIKNLRSAHSNPDGMTRETKEVLTILETKLTATLDRKFHEARNKKGTPDSNPVPA